MTFVFQARTCSYYATKIVIFVQILDFQTRKYVIKNKIYYI